MDFKKLAPISIICTMVVVGCSFQKNPNKTTPEPVKVGMTKHELEDEIINNSTTTFPDRLAYLIKKDDMPLATKLISEVSKDKVNEYSASGETAIEISVRANLDDLTMLLLSKGASPYLPRKGTRYAPIDYLNERGEAKVNILDMVSIADREFQKSGEFQLMYGPEGLIDFLISIRQPFFKKVNGKTRLIDIIFDGADQLATGKWVYEKYQCEPNIDVVIGLIEKMEGPITGVSGFKFTRFGAALGSEWLFKRGLNLQKDYTIDQRKEILGLSSYRASLRWTAKVFASISLDGIAKEELNSMMIRGIKERSKSSARSDIEFEEVRNFLTEYPDVYSVLYESAGIAKELEEQKKAQERGEVVNSDLPEGKDIKESPLDDRVNSVYQQIIDLNEEYKSCIDKK